jgi:hypothetical protein
MRSTEQSRNRLKTQCQRTLCARYMHATCTLHVCMYYTRDGIDIVEGRSHSSASSLDLRRVARCRWKAHVVDALARTVAARRAKRERRVACESATRRIHANEHGAAKSSARCASLSTCALRCVCCLLACAQPMRCEAAHALIKYAPQFPLHSAVAGL